MLTVSMEIADVIMLMTTMVRYCAFDGLVPPHSPKLGLAYLKTKTHRVVSNIDTRPHARMRLRGRRGLER
jgi:hypothetical protein